MRRSWLIAGSVVLFALTACGGGPTPTAAPGNDRPTAGPASSPAAEPSPGEEKAEEPKAAERASDAAPDFTVMTFGGERFALGEQLGMPVVINFFDSW